MVLVKLYIYIYINNVETTSVMTPNDIEITFTTLILVKKCCKKK